MALVWVTSASTNLYPQTEDFTPNLEEENFNNTHNEKTENIKEFSNSNATPKTENKSLVPIVTGKDNSTPIGSFKIVNKTQNPWYSPKGIPGGTPENPRGTRWLG